MLVVVDNWSKYTVLIPMKCKGLIEAGMLKLTDRKEFRALAASGKDSWDAERVAYKL
eukprot:SAG31_NODE_2253_length_6075_cov_2.406459_1_plen_56_part_10